MRIDAISNYPIDFQKKQRFITPKMKEDIEFLLTKMNQETNYQSNETSFYSKFLKSLRTKNYVFRDGRILIKRVPKDAQMQKESLITLGKTQLVVNNKNGEIIDYHKPFFTTWSKIIKHLDTALNLFRKNFDNSEIVEKQYLSMEGFTPKGNKILNSLRVK